MNEAFISYSIFKFIGRCEHSFCRSMWFSIRLTYRETILEGDGNVFELTDRVAIITGGTSGIGEAIAKMYAQQGAKVVVSGRNEEEGQRIVKEIEEKGGTALFSQTDVSSYEEVKGCVQQTLDTFGTIDILVNSAGIHDEYKTVLEMSEDEYDKLMDVNLKGAFLMTKEALPVMLEKGKGNILNVGSQGTFVAGPGGAAYVMSKHAIDGLTKQLAYDFGQKGIKANTIAPGFIETPMTEGIEDERLKDIPAGRAGKAEEIAALAVFLASDAADYIQGAAIKADGGWTVGR